MVVVMSIVSVMMMVVMAWSVSSATAAIATAVPKTGAVNLLDSTVSPDTEDQLLKKVVWKRCYRRINPACLKLSLVRTVEMVTKDSALTLLPGVSLFSNTSETTPMPADLARGLSSDLAPLDEFATYSVSRFLRSLTLNVNLADFVTGGNKTLQTDAVEAFSGRKKGGFGGYGLMAAMLGGTMATMMMAGLAALAGKALMTSMLALMMSAFSAMRGGGGGGGGGETKTYEVITKPIVSHINTHSSEVQHEHHGHYHKRSVDNQLGDQGGPVLSILNYPGKNIGLQKRGKRQVSVEEDSLEIEDNPHSLAYNHYTKGSEEEDSKEGDGFALKKFKTITDPSYSDQYGKVKRNIEFKYLPNSNLYRYVTIPQHLKSAYSFSSV